MKIHPREIYDLLLESSRSDTAVQEIIIGLTWTFCRTEGIVSPQATQVKPRQIVGVGNVGRIPGQTTYTLYSPNTNQIKFRTVRYGSAKGFWANKQVT